MPTNSTYQPSSNGPANSASRSSTTPIPTASTSATAISALRRSTVAESSSAPTHTTLLRSRKCSTESASYVAPGSPQQMSSTPATQKISSPASGRAPEPQQIV